MISKINRNEAVKPNEMFLRVFELGQQIAQETGGAFDMTVAPLVNAWGFGFRSDTKPTTAAIDSIRQFVGYNKVRLHLGRIEKQDPRLMLDCSAIAKGYGVDCVAALLRQEGVKNFMVEIGGEVITSGINPERLPWRIGVVKPTDDSLQVNQEPANSAQRDQPSHGHQRKLPQFLLSRRTEICPHHRPADRKARSPLAPLGHSARQQLRHGRRLRHGIHGHGNRKPRRCSNSTPNSWSILSTATNKATMPSTTPTTSNCQQNNPWPIFN